MPGPETFSEGPMRAALALCLCAGFLLLPSPSPPRPNPLDGLVSANQARAAEELDERTPPFGPILVVAGKDSEFAAYYPEILKAEGLNLYAEIGPDQLTPRALGSARVVLLATMGVPAPALAALERWVRGGGVLIAMRPDERLLPLAGLRSVRDGFMEDGYLLGDPSLDATKALAHDPLRIHGLVRLYETADGPTADPPGDAPVTVASLSADAATRLPNPAVAMRAVGRGKVIVFAFDLARSIVFTRQGNSLWADEPRAGPSPHRANDLFFPGYLDLARIGVPQADEEQRLLANLILTTADAPLPRFWYLPRRLRAVIVMTGDDHATTSGTEKFFAKLAGLSPPGCRLADWECPRATAYLTPGKRFSSGLAARYEKMGFELGVHVDTGCRNEDDARLGQTVGDQLRSFRARYETVPRQETHRIHCIVWNGWTVLPQIERRNGIRYDLNYYHWPPNWIRGRPGFLTGSGFPMPYATEDGQVLDIYQAASHLVNESGVPQRSGVEFMLRRALGKEQFFGAFGTHYDYSDRFADILVDAARRFDVPMITAEQMLTWTDARNRSRIEEVEWRGSELRFKVRLAPGAAGADLMLPESFGTRRLSAVRCGRGPIPFSTDTIKGIEMAFIAAQTGACEARYGYEGGRGRAL